MKNNLLNNNNNSELVQTNQSFDASKRSILKKAREAKGLTLENVHEATKIPMDVLRAIEEGYSVRSVTPFYLKGFIKMYAMFLEVNPSEVMEALPPQRNNIRKVSDIERDSFDAFAAIDKILTRKRKQQLAVGIGVVIALFILVKAFGFIKSKWPVAKNTAISKKKADVVKPIKEKSVEKSLPKNDTHKETGVEEHKEIKVKEVVAEKAPVVEKEVASKPVESKEEVKSSSSKDSSTSVARNVVLTARAKKDIWLIVKSDDQVVFQSTLSTGSVETWLANKNIEISGRNLNQLEFELNGKMMGPLGRQDRQAKRIVFTKDGLSVTK